MKASILAVTFALAFALAFAPGAARAQCLLQKLTPAAVSGDQAGLDVALRGDVAVLSTSLAAYLGPQSGAVFVFERVGETWVETGRLLASDGAPYDHFGESVAVDGSTLVVGAPFDDDGATDAGSVYVFERGPLGWTEAFKLRAPAPGAGDQLGRSVAIAGDRVLAGAPGSAGPGAAHLFQRAAGAWAPAAVLVAADGFDGNAFGRAVSLSGDTALVGAPGFMSWMGAAAAYVFEHAAGLWFPTAKIPSPHGQGDFGVAVSASGDLAVVGAPNEYSSSGQGAAYVYVRETLGWSLDARLAPCKGSQYDAFGWAVGASGDVVLVGSPGDILTSWGHGAVHYFHRAGGTWTQQRVTAADDPDYLGFGSAVALDQERALIGAPTDDDAAAAAGAAYLWTASPAPALSGSPAAVSIARGDQHDLLLSACSGNAGDPYLVAGSWGVIQEDSPAYVFGSYLLPVEIDSYFLHTLAHPGQPPLAASVGLLDGESHAAAAFAVPPGTDPALAGITLYHAFAAFDPSTWGPTFVSNAMPVTLDP